MSQVISLINEKGGVGKSTSSITISQILAISGYKVLTVDWFRPTDEYIKSFWCNGK